jgi:hypothetical protein
MSKDLELTVPVHFQHSLKTHIFTENLTKTILDNVNTIPALQSLRMDIELTLYICKLLETLMINCNEKLLKKQLVISILLLIFPNLTEPEKALIDTQIQFLFNNRKIKVVKTLAAKFYRSGKVFYKTFMSL